LNTLENIIERMDLENGCNLLTEREKQIISLYYIEGYRDEEIAVFYGVSRQTINESRQNGINKLKKI